MAEPEQHIATEDVRSGSTPHIVRYVLGISLLMAIVVMVLVVLGFKL